jgi:hypothetical protein
MTAILSCLRSVPIFPVGAEKPLSINRPTRETVEAAREAVIADQEAAKILREPIGGSEMDTSSITAVSTAVDPQLGVQTGDLRRSSNASIRNVGQRHNVGLRRAGQAPDGLQ